MAVSAHAIRVQLPGGAMYATAFTEAAAKTGARSGLPARRAQAFTDLVDRTVALLNEGSASMITLHIELHEDTLGARIVGNGAQAPPAKLRKRLESAAAKKARTFDIRSTKTATTVTFRV